MAKEKKDKKKKKSEDVSLDKLVGKVRINLVNSIKTPMEKNMGQAIGKEANKAIAELMENFSEYGNGDPTMSKYENSYERAFMSMVKDMAGAKKEKVSADSILKDMHDAGESNWDVMLDVINRFAKYADTIEKLNKVIRKKNKDIMDDLVEAGLDEDKLKNLGSFNERYMELMDKIAILKAHDMNKEQYLAGAIATMDRVYSCANKNFKVDEIGVIDVMDALHLEMKGGPSLEKGEARPDKEDRKHQRKKAKEKAKNYLEMREVTKPEDLTKKQRKIYDLHKESWRFSKEYYKKTLKEFEEDEKETRKKDMKKKKVEIKKQKKAFQISLDDLAGTTLKGGKEKVAKIFDVEKDEKKKDEKRRKAKLKAKKKEKDKDKKKKKDKEKEKDKKKGKDKKKDEKLSKKELKKRAKKSPTYSIRKKLSTFLKKKKVKCSKDLKKKDKKKYDEILAGYKDIYKKEDKKKKKDKKKDKDKKKKGSKKGKDKKKDSKGKKGKKKNKMSAYARNIERMRMGKAPKGKKAKKLSKKARKSQQYSKYQTNEYGVMEII